MLKEGDTYIRFTKYGSVIIGTVKKVGEINVVDSKNKVCYKKQYMVTDKDIPVDLDGTDGQVFKVERTLSDSDLENIRELSKTLKFKKV